MSQVIHLNNAQEKSLLRSLSGIQFSHILDVMIIMPLAPMLMRTFALSAVQFGLLVSAYTFMAAISSILAAMVIDRFDRRRVVLVFFAAFIVATMLCAVAPSYHLLLLARGLSGVFGGVLGSLVHVYIADCFAYEHRGRATGKITAAFSAATVLGVPFSLLLVTHTPLGWRAPFIVVATLAMVFWWMAYKAIPSIPTRMTDQRWSKTLVPMKQVLSHANHWRAFAYMFLMMMGGFTVIPYITLYSTLNLHFAETLLPVLYLSGGAFTFFTSQWIGRLADRHGKARVFRIVAVLAMLPILAMTNVTNIPWWGVLCITTPFFVFVSGRFVPGMAIITSSAIPHLRGTFMGINSAVQSIGSSIATLLAGFIITINANGMLEHYNIVGYIACSAILATLWLVGKIQIASTNPAEKIAI
ncbi:MAG: MFS transporter [Gallionellaceae bacterium]|jgi:predicted MFS family arabinose efflux permease